MLKKIKINQLKIGMYVKDVDKGWLDIPFFKHKIETEPQIEKLKKYYVESLIIDTNKGKDIGEEAEDAEDDKLYEDKDAGIVVTDVSYKELETIIFKPIESEESKEEVALQAEFPVAQETYVSAIQVTHSLLDNVRSGKNIDEEQVKATVSSMINTVMRNHHALFSVSKIRKYDEYTFTHCVNVATLSIVFARALGYSKAKLMKLGEGALLHDVGKMRIPPSILNKPSKLTDEEFATMKKHVELGMDYLEHQIPPDEDIFSFVAEHHENVDGSGYPKGKNGNEISEFGMIAAIADVYDALTSERVYHTAMPPSKALAIIYNSAGNKFNRALTEQFIACLGIFPIGSFVKLNTGELAVVVSVNPMNLVRPKIKIFTDAQKNMLREPYEVDLSIKNSQNVYPYHIERVINPQKENLGITSEEIVLLGSVAA